MPGYKVRRQKFGVLPLIVLVLAGGVFLAAGLAALNSGKIDPSWARVTGEVRGFISQKQDGKDVYAPTVDYTVSGQKYTAYGNVFSSFQPDTGEEQEVAYNPAKPDESKVVAGGTTKFVLLIFPAVGALLLFFGITMFVKSILRTRNIDNNSSVDCADINCSRSSFAPSKPFT